MFITGIFAFLGFGFPTQNLMPQGYYEIHHPKKLTWTYKRLKVELFRKFLLATLWRNRQQRKRYFDGTAGGFSNLETQSKKSEFGHLIPLVILTAVGCYFIFRGMIGLGFSTLLINLLGNLYPVILQRHHRMRIQAIKQRISRMS